MNKEEQRSMRVELQMRLDILNKEVGLSINVNVFDLRQIKTYLSFLNALDEIEAGRRDCEKKLSSLKLTSTNIARISGISKSTIDHNDDFRAILGRKEPSLTDEPVLSLKEHQAAVKQLKQQINEYQRRESEHMKRELDYILLENEKESIERELKIEQEARENLYNKVERLFKSNPDIESFLDGQLPELRAFLFIDPTKEVS